MRVVGVIIGGLAIGACLQWYDWRLALIIMLAILGNNIERNNI